MQIFSDMLFFKQQTDKVVLQENKDRNEMTYLSVTTKTKCEPKIL